jgi:Clostripain family
MKTKRLRTPRPALTRTPATGRAELTTHDPSIAAAASVAAGVVPPTKRAIKQILVYMSTSTPELLDLARSAQQSIRETLTRVLEEDARPSSDRQPHFKGGDRGVRVHGLVHGYQTEGRVEIGASRFCLRLDDEIVGPEVEPTSLSFVPGDEIMVAEWVRDTLAKLGPDEEIDSTMLVFWGHGAGVGTTLSLPRRVNVGSGGVRRPCLLNIGGLKDGVLARRLNETMPGTPPPGRFDILVFDSCLMAGAELAFEYRGLARYVVASQTLVETEPGGPPGLNLGGVVAAFLKEGAWGQAAEPKRKSGDLLDSATQIAELVGDGRSGAQQLTVFDLDDTLSDQGPATSWLEDAAGWLDGHRLERESDDLRALIRRVANAKARGVAFTPDLQPMIVRAAEELQRLRSSLGLAGLLWLFSRLLTESSFDEAEKPRILSAFRNANFRVVRQFLDLRDLARQVHQQSHNRLLQLVALALMAELTPSDGSFVVAHRLAAPLREKARLSGVSIYCPWFRARGTADAARAFDIVIDHGRYRALDLPQITGWADFVFGPLFEATSAARQPLPTAALVRRPDAGGRASGSAFGLLVGGLCGTRSCGCGHEAGDTDPDDRGDGSRRGVLNGDKPSGHALVDGKPSGVSLVDGKPSGHALVDGKPSGHSLGPDLDD